MTATDSIYRLIARKLTRALNGKGEVTPQQVADVASGKVRAVSHPVINALFHELKRKGMLK